MIEPLQGRRSVAMPAQPDAPVIEARALSKVFHVSTARKGRLGAALSLVVRDVREVRAVDAVTFSIGRGEMVGYIGANGAGKSTTIKMLTGILRPSGGAVRVLGCDPQRQRQTLARCVGAVVGQRTQLWWDLPLIESLQLLQHLYRLPRAQYEANLQRLRTLLDLDAFLQTPVRQLSLGQRMRGDLAAALLHEPEVLYLDEPTIGLDVVAKARIREFLAAINRDQSVTVLLTTHDMGDIAHLCRRIIILDGGRILFDGALDSIARRFGAQRTLVVDVDGAPGPLIVPGATWLRSNGTRHWLAFDGAAITASALIARLADRYSLLDLTVEEPAIEAIVRRIYDEGLPSEERLG